MYILVLSLDDEKVYNVSRLVVMYVERAKLMGGISVVINANFSLSTSVRSMESTRTEKNQA